MRIRSTIVVLFAMAWAGPAHAADHVIQLGGMCSQNWLEGKGGGSLGAWSNVVEVSAAVDQRSSKTDARTDLVNVLNSYCTGNDWCWIFNYSGGDFLTGYTLDTSSSAPNWNIHYVVTVGGAGGGSNLAGGIADLLTCDYSNELTESAARNAYNHNDTSGKAVYRLGGYKKLVESTAACVAGTTLSVLSFGLYNNSHCLNGDHDGAVEYHSAGACTDTNDHTDMWNQCSHWTNHYSWWTPGSYDEGDNLNHYELKMFGVCMEGGVSGVSGYSACMSYADSKH